MKHQISETQTGGVNLLRPINLSVSLNSSINSLIMLLVFLANSQVKCTYMGVEDGGSGDGGRLRFHMDILAKGGELIVLHIRGIRALLVAPSFRFFPRCVKYSVANLRCSREEQNVSK